MFYQTHLYLYTNNFILLLHGYFSYKLVIHVMVVYVSIFQLSSRNAIVSKIHKNQSMATMHYEHYIFIFAVYSLELLQYSFR